MDKFIYQRDDKCIRISGPCEMTIEVAFDDVWHEQVEKEVKKLVALLNKHWEKPCHTDESKK